MKTTYPVILREVEGGYLVEIPGFEINTFGATQYEAIEMARDAIGVTGLDKIEHGEPLPQPISAKEAKALSGDYFFSVVDVDFGKYRDELDKRLVRKNLTIPYYLNVKAENMGINFSHVLREAVEDYIERQESKEE
jgi:predicted RNase H-like HicB family nuclease